MPRPQRIEYDNAFYHVMNSGRDINKIINKVLKQVAFHSKYFTQQEFANLKTTDIDYDRGTVLIRQGKGNKDRMIPIGERALSWV
jgi:site-specific recombinase XerC